MVKSLIQVFILFVFSTLTLGEVHEKEEKIKIISIERKLIEQKMIKEGNKNTHESYVEGESSFLTFSLSFLFFLF